MTQGKDVWQSETDLNPEDWHKWPGDSVLPKEQADDLHELTRLRGIEAAAKEVVRTRDAALDGVSRALPDGLRKNLHAIHADAIEALRLALSGVKP